MDSILHTLSACSVLLDWHVQLGILAGILIGVVVGAMPGLGPTAAIALSLPFTFGVAPEVGIPFLMSIYAGSSYGCSISAILINIPGTSAAIATCWDGNQMALKGDARRGLLISLYGSVFGNVFSTIVLILFASSLATVALKFGPVQLFAILTFSFVITGAMDSTESKIKGIMSGALGFLIGTIGRDPIVGSMRFDFFGLARYDSLNQTAILIGAFALSESFNIVRDMMKEKRNEEPSVTVFKQNKNSTFTVKEFFSYWKELLEHSVLGAFMGAIPGIGSTVASLVSYGLAKSHAKHPEEFGKGSTLGILAPETANNATCGSNLLPYLSLGIPGSPLIALVGSALLMQGIAPGPTIFMEHGDVIYKIFAALMFSNITLLIVGKSAFNNLASKLMLISKKMMVSAIVVLCVAGVYCVNNRMYDVYILFGAGIFAYIMKTWKMSIAPMIVAFVLSRSTETAFRQSMVLADGNLGILVSDPISLVSWILCIGFIAISVYLSYRKKRKANAAVA